MAPPPPSDEIHIASLVVHALPRHVDAVSATIAAMPGAQVHGASATGKLVVTLESGTDSEMLSAIDTIQRLRGVMTAALVYQCADRRDAMEEEVLDANRPT